MSAILSLFGVGQKDRNTDRSTQLGAWGNLSNLATGERMAGTEDTGLASRHAANLLSGDPTAVASAVAPTTNAVAAQAAAAGRQRAATGTSRGGGGNTQDQQTSDLISGATQTAINTAVPGAATTLGSLGTTQAGQAASAAGTVGSQSGETREYDTTRSDKLVKDSVDQVAQLLKAIPGFGSTTTGSSIISGIGG